MDTQASALSSSTPSRDFIDHLPPFKPDIPHVWDFPLNDGGRAALFLQHFGEIVRYVPDLGAWRIWHGGTWHDDNTGRMGAYCQHLSRHEQAAAAEERLAQIEREADRKKGQPTEFPKQDEKEGKRQLASATALGNEKTIRALLSAASCQASVIVPLADWDASTHHIGVTNGIIDLHSLVHRPAHQRDYITKLLAVAYDASATCPGWDRFIARILPGALGAYVQAVAGYSLTGSTDDESFYFLYGTGQNGKSILMETLASIFADYAQKARSNLVEEPRNGGDCKTDLATLPGIRFLHGEEAQEGRRLREGTIKSLVVGDTLTGEKKYCAPFNFNPVAKLWIMGNHKPRIEGADLGIWRRVKLIPFETVIPEAEIIPRSELLARFVAERSGILNWMLRGLADNPQLPLRVPAAVAAAVAEYKESEDDLAEFIADCVVDIADCIVENDSSKRADKRVLFAAYLAWAKSSGVNHPWTAKKLTQKLQSRTGWLLDSGKRYWIGQELKPNQDLPECA